MMMVGAGLCLEPRRYLLDGKAGRPMNGEPNYEDSEPKDSSSAPQHGQYSNLGKNT